MVMKRILSGFFFLSTIGCGQDLPFEYKYLSANLVQIKNMILTVLTISINPKPLKKTTKKRKNNLNSADGFFLFSKDVKILFLSIRLF